MSCLARTRFALAIMVPLALAVASGAMAAGGRTEIKAFYQSTLKSADYQKKTFDRVAKKWKQPARGQVPALGKKTVVQAIIAADGSLVSTIVSMESGSRAWDAAALAAVERAAPFDPLPRDYAHPSLEVHFHVAWVASR